VFFVYKKYIDLSIYDIICNEVKIMKIAFLYAGQGSQYVGMGKELYEAYPEAKTIFDEADAALSFDLKQLCFEENEDINKTEYTQPAVVAVGAMIKSVLNSKGINADVTAGLSLGEYTALYEAGAYDLKTLVTLVNKRGKIMQEAVPSGISKMAVILGLEDQKVLDLCTKVCSASEKVEPANYNCPGQVVVAGHNAAVDRLIEAAKEAGAKRALEIAVSVPSHTSLMEGGANEFTKELDKLNVNELTKPVYANVTGEKETTAEVKLNLTKQMSKSTYMGKIIKNMIESGVDTFIEIGPGKALTGFVRGVNRELGKEIKFFNVENEATLTKVLEELK
jgi:[acyl-carrier-protein] S-malonyltransferase